MHLGEITLGETHLGEMTLFVQQSQETNWFSKKQILKKIPKIRLQKNLLFIEEH